MYIISFVLAERVLIKSLCVSSDNATAHIRHVPQIQKNPGFHSSLLYHGNCSHLHSSGDKFRLLFDIYERTYTWVPQNVRNVEHREELHGHIPSDC